MEDETKDNEGERKCQPSQRERGREKERRRSE